MVLVKILLVQISCWRPPIHLGLQPLIKNLLWTFLKWNIIYYEMSWFFTCYCVSSIDGRQDIFNCCYFDAADFPAWADIKCFRCTRQNSFPVPHGQFCDDRKWRARDTNKSMSILWPFSWFRYMCTVVVAISILDLYGTEIISWILFCNQYMGYWTFATHCL